MKRLKLLLLTLVALATFNGCTKESADLIVGTWIMDCQKSTMSESLESPDESWTDHYTLAQNGIAAASFTFNADGTGSMTTSYLGEGTFTDPITYTIDDNRLVLSPDESYRITKLDKKQLVLDDNGEINEDGDHYTYSIHFELNRKN